MSRIEPEASASSPPSGDRVQWNEIDWFRGVAAVFMILNHLAVSAPSQSGSRLIGGGELIGGFAPVLFYFATGLGYGIQSASKARNRGYGFLTKVGILIVADSDFFLFIGLSMLLLELVRRMPRSEWVAAALLGLSVGARFLVGPALRSLLKGQPWELWAGDFLGTGGHFGYPMGPWLAYPMLGYLAGRFADRNREPLRATRLLPFWLIVAGLPFAALASVVMLRGNVLFRYGTMSLSYFLASLAVIAWVLAFAVLVERSQILGRVLWPLSLSGLRSFAVVPLHYSLHSLIGQAFGTPKGSSSYAGEVVVVLILSFVGSSVFMRLVKALSRPEWRWPIWVAVTLFTLVYYVFLRDDSSDVNQIYIRSILQLALCVLLSFRAISRVATPKEPRSAERVLAG